MTVTKEMIEDYARIRVEAALYVIADEEPSERRRIEFSEAIDNAEAQIDAALSAQPVAVPDGWVLESGQAFANQVRAIVYKLHGQSYSSTVSALNRFDADLRRARAMLVAAPQPPMPEVNGLTEAQLLARVAAVICEETCGLTSECKSREAASALLKNGYLATTPPADQQENERKPLDLNVTREWFEKRAALEGDNEIGAGRRTMTLNLTSEEIAELERMLPNGPELQRLKAALDKINDIRNSIIGCQTMNWSEHIYPLVAALEDAGISGMKYPEARANMGTLIERTNAAEARVKTMKAALEAVVREDGLFATEIRAIARAALKGGE